MPEGGMTNYSYFTLFIVFKSEGEMTNYIYFTLFSFYCVTNVKHNVYLDIVSKEENMHLRSNIVF